MIAAILLFGLIVSAFEITVVWKVQPLYRFITNHQYGTLTGIIFSVSLSLMVASFFGAAGTIAMGGAVLGTLITAVIYEFKLIEAAIAIKEAVVTFNQAIHNFVATVRDSVIAARDAVVSTRDSMRAFRNRIHAFAASCSRTWNTIRHPLTSLHN